MLRNQGSQVNIIGSESPSYFIRLIHVYLRLIFTNSSKYDVIYAGFAPQLYVNVFKHRFRKQVIIEDFFISLYDTCCHDRKYFHPAGLIGRYLHHLDTKTLACADLILSDTKAQAKYYVDEFHADFAKIKVLYLEAHIDNNSELNPAATDRNSTFCPFTVLYFGSILPLQGIDIVLKAFDLLKDTPNIHLIFIGPLNKDKRLLSLAPHSDNIQYIEWLNSGELYRYIHQADLCLAGHFDNSIMKAQRTIPGKAYIYEALNKPMILGDTPANHERYNESMDRIYFVPTGDAKALANKILELMPQLS